MSEYRDPRWPPDYVPGSNPYIYEEGQNYTPKSDAWITRKEITPKKTWCGRIVRRNKKHAFKPRDVDRILEKTREAQGEEGDWLAKLLLKLMAIFDDNNPFIQWWPPMVKEVFHVVRVKTADILATMIRDAAIEPIDIVIDAIDQMAAIVGADIKILNLEEVLKRRFTSGY